MNDDELKNLWRTASQDVKVTLHTGELREEINRTLKKVDRTIRLRNMRELAVIVVLIPIFAFIAYSVQPLLSKIGAIMIIPSCLLVVYTLRRVKRYRVKDATLPFQEYLLQYRNYLEQEKKLLDNVLWWYILPGTGSIMLFFIGFRSFIMAAFALVIAVIIFVLNKYTAGKYFKPLVESLDEQIAVLQK